MKIETLQSINLILIGLICLLGFCVIGLLGLVAHLQAKDKRDNENQTVFKPVKK